MRVFIEDTFDSAHWLPNVPKGHKCRNVHGHTYKVRIEVEGPVNKKSGWVIDYAEIKKAREPLKLRLDHKVLNEIKGLENSTSENLVEWIWVRLQIAGLPISLIEVRETANCGAVKTK
jgi:6-pyruvoyltetrahydropterin/6-carboxytetrahydropterin synthase